MSSSREALDALNRSGRAPSQAERILWRLQQGPATNIELAQIGIRYSARIHELRQQGHNIVTDEIREDGTTVYALKPAENATEQQTPLWSDHAAEMRARKPCAFCGRNFVPETKWQHYCSYRCRQVAHGRMRA